MLVFLKMLLLVICTYICVSRIINKYQHDVNLIFWIDMALVTKLTIRKAVKEVKSDFPKDDQVSKHWCDVKVAAFCSLIIITCINGHLGLLHILIYNYFKLWPFLVLGHNFYNWAESYSFFCTTVIDIYCSKNTVD